ncbi:MAG: GGDEF domain-containing protein [Nitrospiraceae bacterium]|nr:MAG: GGDEF domain-containing protein [Nitrospiraceae bacterium]
METGADLGDIFDRLRDDLRSFIELSLDESEDSWKQWLSLAGKKVDVKCWEKKNCDNISCPAYKNTCGRCWLIAGTMCGGIPRGKFALKYENCTKCDVYQEAVLLDPVNEVYEHLITLVHSLRSRQQEFKSLALHDALTGLYNRNYSDIIINREQKRIRRIGGTLTLYVIDLDKFKYINDTYGHIHGDGVLREFALILKKSVRDTDLVVRYGGDEFLIIKHESPDVNGNGMINRIRRSVEDWNKEYGSENYAMSFSYGYSVMDQSRDFKLAFEDADAMMYANKNSKT